MKTNIWNIKDVLHIPTASGGSRVPNQGGASSDLSSLTDSQFLMGSQFWPENSQSLMSQDLSLCSRNTKQSSEEGSEWRLSTNYRPKPYLFGGDTEINTSTSTSSKPASGMLDRFSEDKKRAKDKVESETMHQGFLQFNTHLEKTNDLLESVNTRSETTHKALVERISDLARTIKENMASVPNSIRPKIETVITKLDFQDQKLRDIEEKEIKNLKDLLERANGSSETTHSALVEGLSDLTRTIKEMRNSIRPKIEDVMTKLDCQDQALKDIEDREVKMASAIKGLSTQLQDLQRNMDSLKVEQGQEQSVLAKMQSLLAATLEATAQKPVPKPIHMVSSEVQTSPSLTQRFCVASHEEEKHSELSPSLTSTAVQTSTAVCDQRVPSRGALCPLPTNQEQVMHMAAGGMKEGLWQQSVCIQMLKPTGDAAADSGLTKPQGRYALRQQVSRSIVGAMPDDSQIISVSDSTSTQLWPVRQDVMTADFPVRKGYHGEKKSKSKKRHRGQKRALIPSRGSSFGRAGPGRRAAAHKARSPFDYEEEEEEEEDDLSPLYHLKNKAFRSNVKPPQKYKENDPFHMAFEEDHSTTPANMQIAEVGQEVLWNLFDFDDSD